MSIYDKGTAQDTLDAIEHGRRKREARTTVALMCQNCLSMSGVSKSEKWIIGAEGIYYCGHCRCQGSYETIFGLDPKGAIITVDERPEP